MSEKVIQIVPAETGWRHVHAYLGARGDLATLPDDRLYGVTPIACWALIEHDDEWRSVQHVVPYDWPQFLSIPSDDERGSIGYLAPGEEPDHHYREEAIEQITAVRERDAARTPK